MNRLLVAVGLCCAFGASAQASIITGIGFCEETDTGLKYTLELILEDCVFIPDLEFQPFFTLVDIPGVVPPDPIVDFERPSPYPWVSELFVDLENENAPGAGVFDDPTIENLSVVFIAEQPDVEPLNGPFVLGTLSFVTIGAPVLFELSFISGAFDGAGVPLITGGTVSFIPASGPVAMFGAAVMVPMARRRRR